MKNYTFIVLFLFGSIVFAQDFSITSQKIIGGAGGESLSPHKSPDGTGYFFVGASTSDISGDKTENSFGGNDVWVVKTDNNFNVLWDKTYGGSGEDEATNTNSVFFQNDRLTIVASSNSPISGNKTIAPYNSSYDIWMLEIDMGNGAIIEEHLIGGNGGDLSPKVVLKDSETIYLAFKSNSSNSGTIGISSIGYSNVYLCEYSLSSKTVQKEAYIGTSDFDNLLEVKLLNDTIVTLVQSSGGNNSLPTSSYGQADTYLCKLDTNLTLVTTKKYGGTGTDGLSTLLESNGFYYALGSSDSPISGNKQSTALGSSNHFWMVKFDADMNYLWDVSYGGFGHDFFRNGYVDNNGRIVAGLSSDILGAGGDRTCPIYGGSDGWIIVLDPENGDLVAQTSFGGSAHDYLRNVFPLNDAGGMLVSMSSASGVSGNKTLPSKGGFDLWLMEVDASDYLSIEEQTANSYLAVFPNPTGAILNIQSEQPVENIQVTNSSGKLILSTTEQQINVSNFSNGLYFVQLRSKSGEVVMRKFVKK